MDPASAITAQIDDVRDSWFRVGTVLDVSVPGQVTADVAGSEIIVPTLNSYSPLVGDSVKILVWNGQKLAVGKPGPYIPSGAGGPHSHGQTEVTGLSTALAGKSDTGHTHTGAGPHSHTEADVSGLSDDLTGLYTAVGNKSDTGHTHPAAEHVHTEADVTGLASDLDSKAAAVHGHSQSSVTGLAAALDLKSNLDHGHAETGAHAHGLTDVTGLNTTLAGKSDTTHAHSGTYQPLDTDLTTLAGLTATTSNVIQAVSSAWASRTPAQLAATLPADQAVGTASLRSLGTGATQASPGTHVHAPPNNLIARHRRTTSPGSHTGTSAATAQKICQLDCSVSAGRIYKISANVPMYINAGTLYGLMQAALLYTTDGSTPATTSTQLYQATTVCPPGGYVTEVDFDILYPAATSHTLKLLLANWVIANGSGTSWGVYAASSPAWPLEIAVEDLGVDPGSSGTNFGGVVEHAGAVAMVAAGQLTATATTVAVVSGAVTMAGAGQLTAVGDTAKTGLANLTGAGQLTATGVSTDHGQTALTGAGALTAATAGPTGTATLSGVGGLTAAATVTTGSGGPAAAPTLRACSGGEDSDNASPMMYIPGAAGAGYDWPVGIATGDLVIMCLNVRVVAAGSAQVFTVGANRPGWTILHTSHNSGGTGAQPHTSCVLAKIYTAGDVFPGDDVDAADSISWTSNGKYALSVAAIQPAAGSQIRIANDILKATPVIDTANTTTHDTPDLDAGSLTGLDLVIAASRSQVDGTTAVTATVPAGWTEPALADWSTAGTGSGAAARQLETIIGKKDGATGNQVAGNFTMSRNTSANLYHLHIRAVTIGGRVNLVVSEARRL